MKAHTLLATPQTDAKLKRDYGKKGAKAFQDGKPREFGGDPGSMVGAWWYAGYDAASKCSCGYDVGSTDCMSRH